MNISFIYRKFRKSIAGIALTALLASFVSFAAVASASFPDTDGHWATDYIDELVSQNVVSGYDNGNFGPDDSLTRGQMAKIAVLAFSIELDSTYDAGFADVDSSAWYAEYVNTAAKNGVVGGYTDADGVSTGYFGPDDTVNRAQAAKILVNAASLTTDTSGAPHFDDVASGDWYYDYVETAYNNTVVDGYSDGNYGPADAVTRGQIAKMTVNSQNPVARDTTDTTDDTTSTDGALKLEMISLDGGTVPKGATAVPVLGIKATASGADMTLNSLVLSRSGVGATTDISNLYFYNDTARIGSGHSVSSDSNTSTFNSLNVDVAEGESAMFYIKADFSSSATAGNEHFFSIASDSDATVDSGSLSGTYPIDGETFTIGGASAGTVTISKSSSVSNPTIGDSEATIADFKLAGANENMSVEHIALIAKGTISTTGLENLSLIQNGEVLATAASVDDNQLITFDLDTPFDLSKGDSRTFTVTAEVTSKARPDDTIKIYLDETTDLVAIGQTYGYGAQVTKTAYDNSAADGTDSNWSTVQGGDFTVAFGGPSVSNFAPNAKDIQVLSLTYSSQRDVEVRKLTFDVAAAAGDGLIGPTTAATAANYTDIKLVDTDSGSTLMGPQELVLTGSDATQTITFTDSWYLTAGESVNAAITLDVANEATLDADTIQVTMNAVSTTEGVKDSGTGQYLTDIVPSTTLAGYTHNIQTASLAVALASSPVSDTFVKGTSGVTLAGFVFTAGSASDVTITKILPTLAFCDSATCTAEAGAWSAAGSSGAVYGKNFVGTMYLYDADGNQLGTAEAVPNGGKPTFDGFNLEVSAGSTETVYLVGDVSSSASAGAVGVDLEATSDVTAADADDNSVTLTAANPNGATAANATTVAMTISTGGTIVVSAPSTQVNDQLLAASSSDVLLGRFKVKATSEDYKVDRIVLYSTVSGSEDSFASVKIMYPTSLSAPTTLDGSSSATFTGTAATFANLSFMVPKSNDNVTFEVYVSANSHADDSGATDSGDDLQMTLYPYAATTSSNTFNAVGEGSGATSDGDTSGVIAAAGLSTNHAYVYKTIPTVTVADTAAAIVYGAEAEVFRFTVAAGSNGDLALLGLKFDVSSSGVLTGSTGLGATETQTYSRNDGLGLSNTWKMYEVVSGSVDSSVQVGSGTFLYGTGIGSALTNIVYMQVYQNIANWAAGTGAFAKVTAGSSRTFVVDAPVLDDGVSNTNSVSVRISTDSTAAAPAASTDTISVTSITDYDGTALGSAAFIWSDRPNVSAFGTGATAYWNNGYKVSGIPSSYVTST